MTFIFHEFEYYIHEELNFSGLLTVMKCLDGNCNKIITIGLPYCSNHMQQNKKLIIKQINEIKGKGVFVYDHLKNNNDIVFYKNQIIVDYNGETYNNDELINRYGDYTGPYAVNKFEKKNKLEKEYIDCALHRYIGGMINCSDKYTNPNVKLINCGEILCFVALYDLYNHTELVFDYGNEYKMFEENSRYCTKEITIVDLLTKYKSSIRTTNHFLNKIQFDNLIPKINFNLFKYFNMNNKKNTTLINNYDQRSYSNISELSKTTDNSSYNIVEKNNHNNNDNINYINTELINNINKKTIQLSILNFFPKQNNISYNNINNYNNSISNNNNVNKLIKIKNKTYEINTMEQNNSQNVNYIVYNNKKIELIDLINND